VVASKEVPGKLAEAVCNLDVAAGKEVPE